MDQSILEAALDNLCLWRIQEPVQDRIIQELKKTRTLLHRQSAVARCYNCSALPGGPVHIAALRLDTARCRTDLPSPGPR